MYELLLRTETLLMGLRPPVLLGVGAATLAIGLIFWLAGVRYSSAITGLLGAAVGAAAGLLVGQRFGFHPLLSMLVGAVIVAIFAVLLKKVLILVLAVLVLSAVSGAGYLSVVLDHMAPPPQPDTQQGIVYQSFTRMPPERRLEYINQIGGETGTFADRLDALLKDTWQAIRPHGWMTLGAVVAGAIIAFVLIWLIAKIVIALAYSIVGAAAIFLGLQAALLAVGIRAASNLQPHLWLLPALFLIMVVIGWVRQLLYLRAKPAREPEREIDERPVVVRRRVNG
jgi:hypothetical protein